MSEPPAVEVYDLASLEGFTSELVAAGFEPVPRTARREWIGPVHPAFRALTDADTMRVVVRDGWPVTFPYLFVEGLRTHHLTADGYVCLWEEGEGPGEWTNVRGLFDRIAQWGEQPHTAGTPAASPATPC